VNGWPRRRYRGGSEREYDLNKLISPVNLKGMAPLFTEPLLLVAEVYRDCFETDFLVENPAKLK
jgi:hypothetical protein